MYVYTTLKQPRKYRSVEVANVDESERDRASCYNTYTRVHYYAIPFLRALSQGDGRARLSFFTRHTYRPVARFIAIHSVTMCAQPRLARMVLSLLGRLFV